MKHQSILGAICCAMLISGLTACGGGGGAAPAPTPPPPAPPPTGGISGNGIAIGPINTFGSIVVNGVHYDTSTATFTIDGSAAIESDLKVGDVVLLTGTIDSNGADVEFDPKTWALPATSLMIYDPDDVLVDTITPSGGIWGGDVFDVTVL